MFTGIPFPFPMGISWESHGNGNHCQKWEWEWAGMGINLHGNGNDTYSHGNMFQSSFQRMQVTVSSQNLWENCGLLPRLLKSHIRHTGSELGSCVFQPRRRQAIAFSALPAGCSRNAEQTWAPTLQTACCFYTARPICRYKRRLRLYAAY